MCKAVHGHRRVGQQLPCRGQDSPATDSRATTPTPAAPRRSQRLGNPWQQPRNGPERLLAAGPTRDPRIRSPTDQDGTSTDARPSPATAPRPRTPAALRRAVPRTPVPRPSPWTSPHRGHEPQLRPTHDPLRPSEPPHGEPAPTAPPSAEYGDWSPTRTRHRRLLRRSATPPCTTPTPSAGPPPADPAPWSGGVPFDRARVPQPEQPTTDVMVSTSINNSPSPSAAARRRNPTRTQNRNVQGVIVTSHLWPPSLDG